MLRIVILVVLVLVVGFNLSIGQEVFYSYKNPNFIYQSVDKFSAVDPGCPQPGPIFHGRGIQ